MYNGVIMKDILQDIVKHTHGLGFLDLVKITGADDSTTIDSMAEDRSVILQGTFKKAYKEMFLLVLCICWCSDVCTSLFVN